MPTKADFTTASPQEVESETLAAVQSALETLATKAPDETRNYRQLVLAVATAVADAKDGLSDDETAALGKLREALA